MANPQLTVSSALLGNYKAASIMKADGPFSALQTTEGHALLFSVSTEGVCYFTQESVGTKAGWQKTDLSSALRTSGAIAAKKVAVAQNAATTNIHMALAMSTSTDDAFYLSLGNSAADTSWVQAPSWTPMGFDGASRPFSGQLVINDIFVSEASDGEYVVVDVLQDAQSGTPTIFRYFIDPYYKDTNKALTGKAWNPHDVAGTIDASTVSSVLGRAALGGVVPQPGDPSAIDGLYTMGSFAGVPQLIYQPLYNPYALGQAAAVSYLQLPGGGIGTAMAAVRRNDNCTDLYVASGQSIYFFAAENQDDGDTGVAVLDDPMFAGVEQLFAYRSTTQIILWGLNAAHQVFYTSCAIDNIVGGPWSTPLPLRSGVRRLAPYVNRANDANNFFLHTGPDTLQRAAQARDTTTWNYSFIRLPPDKAKATRASSYTTRVQVNDANGQPLANTPVQISALHRVGVDINGYYQVLDTTPVPVRTDAIGALNIIEWVATPRATPLKVTGPDGTTIAVNPMQEVLEKAASLNTASLLAGALLPNKDGTRSDRPLVPRGANAPSPKDLDTAASAIGHLATIYQTLPADGSIKTAAATASFVAGSERRITVGRVHTIGQGPGRALHDAFALGIGISISIPIPGVSWIESRAGDLLSAVEHAADTVVSVVEDTASGAYHFVATIAGTTYGFVLDAAEKVVGAMVAIYNAIKTVIEDLIAWLEFLLEWGDFKRSMHVCKQVVWLGLNYINDHAADIKPALNQLFDDVRNGVDDWAGVKSGGWAGSVDHPDKPPGFLRTLVDVGAAFTSPAMYFFHHLADNLSGGSAGDAPQIDVAYDAALAALTNQADTIIASIPRLQAVISNIDSFSLEDALKQIAAIVVDAFLAADNAAIDALLDLLAALTQTAIDALGQEVYIPVISDILEDVFGDSANFTLLEFVLMAGAIPGTLLYKSANGSMPFHSGDGFTDEIQAADTLEGFLAQLPRLPQPAQRSPAMMAFAVGHEIGAGFEAAFDTLTTYHLQGTPAKALYTVCHAVAGTAQLLNAVWLPATGGGTFVWWDRLMSSVCGGVSAVVLALSGILSPQHPIGNKNMAILQRVTSLTLFAVKVVALVKADTPDKEKVAAGAFMFLAYVQIVCTVYHFYELGSEPASSERSAAMIDEVTTFMNCFGCFNQGVFLFSKQPQSLENAIGATVVASGLEFADAGVIGNS